MRKLILGIAAIVCIDVGFGALFSINQPEDETVASREGDVVRDVDRPEDEAKALSFDERPEVPSMSDELSSTGSTEVPPTSDELSSTGPKLATMDRPMVKRRLYISKVHSGVVRGEEKIPAPPDFSDVTIVYAAYQPVAFRTYKELETQSTSAGTQNEVSGHAVQELPKTKNRSFGSRAIPILKKPYEVIKAIGAKFY